MSIIKLIHQKTKEYYNIVFLYKKKTLKYYIFIYVILVAIMGWFILQLRCLTMAIYNTYMSLS
jgi:hypothetical protein